MKHLNKHNIIVFLILCFVSVHGISCTSYDLGNNRYNTKKDLRDATARIYIARDLSIEGSILEITLNDHLFLDNTTSGQFHINGIPPGRYKLGYRVRRRKLNEKGEIPFSILTKAKHYQDSIAEVQEIILKPSTSYIIGARCGWVGARSFRNSAKEPEEPCDEPPRTWYELTTKSRKIRKIWVYDYKERLARRKEFDDRWNDIAPLDNCPICNP
jgi:hypothetical protein